MITDNQKALLLELYYERGVLKKEIRSYEASLWTLQDDFLTVLKWSDVEQKGRIEHPKMTLNIDGTLKFSFSIPMYYREKGLLVENPNWYNTLNGNLMTSLRKVKVIFNKDEVDVDNVDWKTLFDKVYVPKGYNGNVDLYNRMIVPALSFIDAGYISFNDNLEEGEDSSNNYGTLYSISTEYTLSDGTKYTIVYTPVAANGTVYSEAAMESYLYGIVSTSDNIDVWLLNDKADRKLILGIFPATSNNSTWGKELHEMLAEWDQIRAKIGMLNNSNNPSNIQFTEPTYDYYKKYLRSVNTFEFIITNVTETHEKDILTCEIESEGLAFLELGKIGYKVSLSQANFELVYKDWYENHHSEEVPLETVDYWCNEAGILSLALYANLVNPRAWYYDIRMNWNSFLDGNSRSPRKVYEEPYVTSWEKSNDIMIPVTEETYREKARPVEINKSNLYNITLTIAETFEIFCRYEFIYDENYHIIGRIIVFYNNFMNEDNMFTILYPYSASKISRKMDSTDTTTKLFILDPDNTTVESGQSSVMNAPPNASKEDYILNFDYMYQTEAITKELYDAIKPFEAEMYDLNEILILYLLELASYLMKKPELEGKIAVAEKSMKVADEQIKLNENKKYALGVKYGDGTDLIKITYKNPDYCIIRTDDAGNKFITTAKANTGINESTVNIYTTKNTKEAAALGINKVTDFKFEHDEYNNITRIVLLNENQLNKLTTINYSNVYSSLCSSIPATQKQHGAVDLKNRPIVSMLKIADAEYPIDNRYGYYSLCALVLSIPANNGPYSGCDIVYTPITVDGEVRSAIEMRTYIDSVSVKAAEHSNTRNWATYDTLKMIIDVVDGGTGSSLYLGDNGIEHNALRNWEKIKYHTGLLEILGLVYINGTKNTTNLELSVNLLIYLENHSGITGGDGLRRVTAIIPVNGDITLSNVSDKIFDDLTQPDINLIMDSNNVTETPLTDMVPALYLTYGYNPKFYYDNIIKTWSIKSKEEKDKMCEYLIQLGPESATDSHYNLAAVYSIYANQDSNIIHKDYSLATTSEKTTILTRAYEKGLNHTINTTEESIKSLLAIKLGIIKEFEHMMGPALREGYWQPEHYDDYGDKKEVEVDLQLTDNVFTTTLAENVDIVAGWDSKLFEEEDTLYYKVGVLETLEYYPCIDLAAVYNGNIPSNLNLLSVVWWSNTITNTVDWSSVKDLGVMAVGSDALIKFIRTGSGVIKPVLMLVGAKTYSAPMLERLIVSGQARIELYDSEGPSHSQVTSIDNHWLCYRSTDATHYPLSWEDNPPNELKNLWSLKYLYVTDKDTIPIVYPRIKFKSLAVKTDSDNLRVLFNDVLFEMAKHFTVLTRNTEYSLSNIVPEYYVTIKPSELIDATIFNSTGVTNTNKFKVNYVISNANTAIYLDAIKVSKENAYPKASYEVSSNILNVDFVRTLYLKLAQIVMINDTDLKFENTFGYISGLELDLDNCLNDTMEVKNYKTKFEDLFSSIVAQTEAMKLSGAGLTTALSGGIPLSEEGLSETLDTLYDILEAYLDSYFDSSLVVKDRLADIFAEAAEILASSLKSLNSMAALTDRNAAELGKFVENIAAELTSEVFRQADRPASFKAGDIWIKMDGNTEVGRYLAIMSSDDLEDLSSETAGFVRTHDGSLANITGAAIDIDAEAGTIDIKAATLINLKSGLDIYIAANRNVDILGNKQVNIGGSLINLCTLSERALNSDGTFTTTKFKQETLGINIIAGAYQANGNYGLTARVLLKPNHVEIGAAELELKAASKMNFVSSAGETNNTSAVHISSEDGIFIGTGTSLGVRIFGGEVKLNNDGTVNTSVTSASGASVELNKDHLILGFMNTAGSGNAIELDKDKIVLASGSATVSNSNVTGTSSGLVGAKFTKDSIGFATSYVENGTTKYNAILMNGTNGITIGSGSVNVTLSDLALRGTNVTGGSYVRIASTGIELGSLADLYINTNNFKLQTGPYDAFGNAIPGAPSNIGTRFAVGKDLQYITRENLANGTIRTDDLSSVTGWVGLVFNDNGLYVRGTIYASAGSFTGSVTATSFLLSGTTAVDNFNSAIIGSSAYTNIPDTIEKLYYMSTSASAPGKPSSKVTTSSTTSTNTWSLTMPEYPSGTTLYYYYTCILTTTHAGNTSWSNPVRENQATKASTITEQFKANGLLSNYTWGGHVFPVALTSTDTMLIGANSGIWIAKPSSSSYTDGAAIAITQAGGIELAGSKITIDSYSTVDINGTNFIVNSAATGTSLLFYVGNSTTNKYIKLLADGTLEIRGKIVATGFELTTSAQSDFNGYVPTIDTGMTIADWGRNWDTTQKYLMIKAGNSVPGGIICGGTDNQSRNFVIPWIAEHALSLDAQGNPVYFETPAFLINKDGLEYRYMTDDGTGRPAVQNYLHINSQGVEVVGSNINITGGNIMINGKAGWSREDIIYAVADSANEFLHPTDRPWIWIKPAASSVVGFSKAFNNGDLNFYTSGTNSGALNGNATIQLNYNAGSSLGTNINVDVTYTISFHSNQSFQSGAYFLLDGALANNSSALNALSWSTGNYATKITPPGYALNLTITWTQTYNNISVFDFSGTPTLYIWISGSNRYLCNMTTLYITNITVTASARATEGAHVPCSVYYYSS